jgi:hypothetical protein
LWGIRRGGVENYTAEKYESSHGKLLELALKTAISTT